jgi:hypothetical protein
MQMGVGEAGQDALSPQVQDPGALSHRRARARLLTDVHEEAVVNGDSTGTRHGGIHGEEAAIEEKQVSAHSAEGGAGFL